MKLKHSLVAAGLAMILGASAQSLMAQNEGGDGGRRGNWDPAQMQQRRLERIREEMDIKDDQEWKVIQERAQKVFEAQAAVFAFRGRGGFTRAGNQGGNQGGGRGGFGQPSPELEALRSAVENNAPNDQIKSALEKYRNARKAKEAALEKAQNDLRKILSVKQEAAAVASGLLN